MNRRVVKIKVGKTTALIDIPPFEDFNLSISF